MFPACRFEELCFATPGDRDRETDLRVSPPDFFTRDLDQALAAGTIDFAIHSAKDLPDPMPAGIDWCWLPWREDARDALVLPPGRTLADLPAQPRIGVSSVRREAFCSRRFPAGQQLPIRGNIEQRLAQLDQGKFDILIMAGAAMVRLGLVHRITEWIGLDELPPPEGQGALAITFRAGDPWFLRLRSLFVKSVALVGAGTSAATCTLGGIEALGRCEVCLYDLLMDPGLLDALPPGAQRINVGKRCGQHLMSQVEITARITGLARKGYRVVRLKGGDPGIFGRLAEEVEALEDLHLPYRVIPGLSSLSAATTGTGMLLTRRGISRGFCVMTPRQQGGGVAPVSGAERARLPVIFFMASGIVDDIARQLIADGIRPDCPAALVFNAGCDNETVRRAALGEIGAVPRPDPALASDGSGGPADMPGLLIVGEVTRFGFRRDAGALQGRRILLTCSQDLQEKAAGLVHDLGGIPVCRPLIRLVPEPQALACVRQLARYDWVVLTSPASVRCFMTVLDEAGTDRRAIPKLMACGPGTVQELKRFHFLADAAPESDFGAQGLLQAADPRIGAGTRVLRLRSDKAGSELAAALRARGAEVEDCILYRNESLAYDTLPEFDAVFFASGSAVEAFVALAGQAAWQGKTVFVIGEPTVKVLARYGRAADLVSPEATVAGSIHALAHAGVRAILEAMT